MPADLMEVMWCSGMSSTFFPTSHPQCCSHHPHLTLIQGLPLPTFLLDNTHNFNWPLVKTALRHGRKSRVPLLFGQCPNRGGNFWNGSSLNRCKIVFYSAWFISFVRSSLRTHPPIIWVPYFQFSLICPTPQHVTHNSCYKFLQHHYIMQLTQQTNRTFII